MPSSGLSLSQIGQIAINIRDLDRAVAFYRDVLGMRLLFQVPPKMAFFDCNGVRLMLDIPEEAEFNHPASILYYKVDDLHAAWAALRDHGADLRHPPSLIARMPDHELWMAFFRDTEGNTLALMSEVRKEVGRVWDEEAERRDQAMESGEEPGIPAEEVFTKLRTISR